MGKKSYYVPVHDSPKTIEEANEYYGADIRTPIIYKGQEIHNYGICAIDGTVYSNLRIGWRVKAWNIPSQTKYPKTQLTIPGYGPYGRRSLMVHVAVHETLNPVPPLLPGVTQKQWDRTPKAVRLACRDLWQVNHIDHSHTNFHPDNLEWATEKQNNEAYDAHRRANSN